jgi:C4-dicarboxylate transporter DctM subunit
MTGFLALFVALLSSGMPVFLVLGLCAGAMFVASGQPLVGAAQLVINELNSPTLMALPLFVMAAAFMRFGGVAKALVDLAAAWLGGLPGSLGLVTVVACTLFAAICGSSVATALAMGTILIPAMLERGYPRSFVLGVVGASGTIGIVIPPSLPLILYGIVAEQSVPRLFLAGICRACCRPPPSSSGSLRRAPPQISASSRCCPRRANTRDLIGAARAARAARRHGRHLWRLRHGDRSRGALRRHRAGAFRCSSIAASTGPDALGHRDGLRSAASIMLIIATALAVGHWMTASGAPARWSHSCSAITSTWQFLLAINACCSCSAASSK